MAIGAAAIGAVGAIGGGLLSAQAAGKQSTAEKRIAREQAEAQYAVSEVGAAERERLSGKAQAEGELATKRRLAAEEAQIKVFGALGAPGTYDMPETAPSGPLASLAPAGLTPLQTEGILSSGEAFLKKGVISPRDVALGRRPKWKGKGKEWSVEGMVMDPEQLASQIKSTSGFRQVSRLVAESEQLLNRRGRLWEEMNNSIVGGIYESSAALHRQAMEELSRDVARGGSARNRAMATAQRFQVQESINKQRTGALWQSKLAMEQWVRANAASVQNFAQAWTQNQSGIRDTFTANLTNLTTFWTQAMAPGLVAAQVSSQTATQQGILATQEMFGEAAKTKSNMYAGYAAAIKGVGAAVSGVLAAAPSSAAPSGAEGSTYTQNGWVIRR